jgi:hypothetical protein
MNIGKGEEGSGCSLMEAPSRHLHGGTEKTRDNHVTITTVQTEKRFEHLQNRSQDYYIYTILLGARYRVVG